MTLIDQRILIDAPAETVWQVMVDPDKLAHWHAGYTNVLLLSTLPTGVGVRRRCTLTNGKDVIEEVVAWVEGFGYEYTYLDGGPYRSLRARFRLQVLPDGTSVQWTITYEPKGLTGKLRDLLRGKRDMANMVAASLRQLRREVDALGVRMAESDRAKAAIRGRLNAEERAEYQRRHTPPPVAAITVAQPGPQSPAQPAEQPPEPSPAQLAEQFARPSTTPSTTPSAAPSTGQLPPQMQPDSAASSDPSPLPSEPITARLSPDDSAAPAVPALESSAQPDTQPDEPSTGHTIKPGPDIRRTASEFPPVPTTEPTDQIPKVDTTGLPGATPLHARPTPPHGTPIVQLPAEHPADPASPADSAAATPPAKPSGPTPSDITPPPPEQLAPPQPAASPATPSPTPPAPPTPEEMSRKTPAHGTPTAARLRDQAALSGEYDRDFRPDIARPNRKEHHPPFSDSAARADLPPQTPMTDTGEISIWDAFGLTRPSEGDEQALNDLLDSVEAKRRTSELLATRPSRSQSANVRYLHTGLGLRLRLAFEDIWVRIHHTRSGTWRAK